jgi:hypothetical protein
LQGRATYDVEKIYGKMEDNEFTRSAAVLQTAIDAVDADVADAGKLSELLAVMQEHVLNHRNPWRMKRIVMEKYSSNRGNIGVSAFFDFSHVH